MTCSDSRIVKAEGGAFAFTPWHKGQILLLPLLSWKPEVLSSWYLALSRFGVNVSRRVCLAGVTRHPNQEWMEQIARNVTMEDSGFLINRRYLLHDRDSKYCSSFGQLIEAGSVKTLALPPRSPNLNAYAERWARSVKEECLSNLVLLSEGSLRRALRHYEAHYHEERNHQGKNNVLLFPLPTQAVRGEQEKVRSRERLGGLLKYYEREAA
jgi:putative transposase